MRRRRVGLDLGLWYWACYYLSSPLELGNYLVLGLSCNTFEDGDDDDDDDQ